MGWIIPFLSLSWFRVLILLLILAIIYLVYSYDPLFFPSLLLSLVYISPNLVLLCQLLFLLHLQCLALSRQILFLPSRGKSILRFRMVFSYVHPVYLIMWWFFLVRSYLLSFCEISCFYPILCYSSFLCVLSGPFFLCTGCLILIPLIIEIC